MTFRRGELSAAPFADEPLLAAGTPSCRQGQTFEPPETVVMCGGASAAIRIIRNMAPIQSANR
jgi:hypothetical protein